MLENRKQNNALGKQVMIKHCLIFRMVMNK